LITRTEGHGLHRQHLSKCGLGPFTVPALPGYPGLPPISTAADVCFGPSRLRAMTSVCHLRIRAFAGHGLLQSVGPRRPGDAITTCKHRADRCTERALVHSPSICCLRGWRLISSRNGLEHGIQRSPLREVIGRGRDWMRVAAGDGWASRLGQGQARRLTNLPGPGWHRSPGSPG